MATEQSIPGRVLDWLNPFSGMSRARAADRLSSYVEWARESAEEATLTPSERQRRLRRVSAAARVLRDEIASLDSSGLLALTPGIEIALLPPERQREIHEAAAKSFAPDSVEQLRTHLWGRVPAAVDSSPGAVGQSRTALLGALDQLVNEIPAQWSSPLGWMRRLEGLEQFASIAATWQTVRAGGGKKFEQAPRATLLRHGAMIFEICRPGVGSTSADGDLISFLTDLVAYALPESNSTPDAIQKIVVRRKLHRLYRTAGDTPQATRSDRKRSPAR